uniref:Telomeric repeat-binding factor 2-interacting protein 1 n=1 Tax=Myripristis murdjan TaxID=586833 RepID=A0A668AH90_9TELE
MSAKKETSRKSHVISPVLFMSVEGEPMRFFVRPSRTKAQLQPYIKAGGGILCKEQEPGATLTAKYVYFTRYVSSQYIRDCIEKNMQLDLEDYRFSSEDVQKCFTSNSSSRNVTGRLAYTPEENAAILKYVSKRKTEVGGNLLWQEMEKQLVTYHSWQSMKYHYKMHLVKRELEVEEEKRTEKENKVICESAQPETAEAQTSRSSEAEVPCLQPQTDAEPVPAESTQPETTEPQTLSSPQPESLPDTSSQTKQKKRQTASPAPAQPQRRSTRRKLELEEPSGRQLRSSSTPQKLVPSPRPAKKAKPVTKPATQKATPVDEPSSKRARGRGEVVVVESRQEENGQAMPSEQAQAGLSYFQHSEMTQSRKTKTHHHLFSNIICLLPQDLVSVTKALLKTSGDFSAALQLLLSPSSFMRPFWNRHDDSLLRSADPEVRQELLDKYGEEHVAKRLMFLEVES